MNHEEILIKVENLKKTYQMGKASIDVLKGVNLSVRPGEFVMLVGPSGSGKSTLLHLVAGLDCPTEGSIEVMGVDVTRASDGLMSRIRNQSIGFIFQFYHLLPELSAYENVVLPSLLSKKDRQSSYSSRVRKADELMDAIGLTDRKMHRPQELSGGEQQRLAIARALINDPKILLADEPTGNLDTVNGNAILELLEQIQKVRKLSILMVTHNPEFLSRADRVIYLKDGRIVE